MILIVLSFFILFVASAVCIIALIIIGYREQVRVATQAANRSAGYWAEVESKLYDAVVELAKQEALAHSEGKRADELARIAREALQIAHHKEFTPPADFNSAKRLLGQTGYPPDEWPEVFDQ